ncbi:MAG: LPP20 family lipoprotein [Sphaerochaeta sp.]
MKHCRQVSYVFFLFAILLLSSSCASISTGASPRWLDTLYDKQYDEDTYLCAVGSGSSREKAVDSALSSLSQVFNSQVNSVTTVLSRSTAQDDGSGEVKFTEHSEMIDQGSITSSTDRIVGAQVVNTYTDANARVSVRVALHREKTAELYQKEVNELDLSIMAVRRDLISLTDPLERYFTLLKAVSFSKRQQNLFDQIQVLLKKSQNSTLIPLERELSGMASSVRVAVSVDSLEDHQVLFSAFSQKLVELGFSVVPLDANPTALLDLQYESTPLELKDSPYKYARYTLSVQLNSGSSTVFTYQKSERVAALSIEDAQKKALIQATTQAVSEFFALLQQNFGDKTY